MKRPAALLPVIALALLASRARADDCNPSRPPDSWGGGGYQYNSNHNAGQGNL